MLFKSTSIFTGLSLVAVLTFSSFSKTPDTEKGNDSLLFLPDTTSKTNLITVNGEYAMRIPKHLKTCKDLNDDASLQYKDEDEEEYIIVIDEAKDEFLKNYIGSKTYDASLTIEENYRKIQMARIKKNVKMKTKPVIRPMKIDKMNSEIVDFDATLKGHDFKLSYKIGFIEAQTKLYFIMCWTLTRYKAGNDQEMEDMIKSFHLVDK
jgi:hypothetical protein